MALIVYVGCLARAIAPQDPWQWIPRRQQQQQQAMHPLALHFEHADMLVSTDTAEPLRMYWPPLVRKQQQQQ